MTRIAIFLIAAIAFFLSGCSTTRKTTATENQAEAQLTATTAGQQHIEATGQTAIITNVQTDEKQNVVIDFAKVEFYPGEVPTLPSDSTAPDWLNAIVPGGSIEDGTKAKPPNVKSITTGRAVINGEKNESRHRGHRNKSRRFGGTTGSHRNQDRGKAEVHYLGLALPYSCRRLFRLCLILRREDNY